MHPPFSLFIKHLCMSMWSMSHFRTSMQRKIEVLLTTMCKYDCRMFGNTWSSSVLTPGSLCGIYSGYSSWLILLKRSPHYGSIILDPMLSLVSPKHGGPENCFLCQGFDDRLCARSELQLPCGPRRRDFAYLSFFLLWCSSASVWWLDFSMKFFLKLEQSLDTV
jgi:hypothetical protein